jgi:hypothetical protein
MKIAIIGGGWVGCHLAYKLKNSHEITLFEKNKNIFQETSYKNQNRLHLGYHYARNSKTRKLCLSTFDKFLNDYNFLTQEIINNLYCVTNSTSLVDYETYLKIFEDFKFEKIDTPLKNVEGCINTNEKYIDFDAAKKFFEQELKNIIILKKIKKSELKKLSKEYNLVINATNNYISDIQEKNFFFELTVSLLYERKRPDFFDSLTFVDGNLFSIFPYKNNLYTVTDVEHTPIKKFKSVKKLNKFISEFNTDTIKDKRDLIESRIVKYYDGFTNDFTYKSYFLSTKSKIENLSEDRSPIISIDGNLINCFTGKIQGIYLIEDYIKKYIANIKNETK